MLESRTLELSAHPLLIPEGSVCFLKPGDIFLIPDLENRCASNWATIVTTNEQGIAWRIKDRQGGRLLWPEVERMAFFRPEASSELGVIRYRLIVGATASEILSNHYASVVQQTYPAG